MLTLLASALSKSVRAADIVCRYGGEEFAAVLPHTGLGVAASLARRIQAAIASVYRDAQPPLVSGGTTVTIGVAVFPHEARDPASLLATADHRLCAGKKAAATGWSRPTVDDGRVPVSSEPPTTAPAATAA